MGLEKETGKREGEKERERGLPKLEKSSGSWQKEGEGGERGREEMARWSLSVGKRD